MVWLLAVSTSTFGSVGVEQHEIIKRDFYIAEAKEDGGGYGNSYKMHVIPISWEYTF